MRRIGDEIAVANRTGYRELFGKPFLCPFRVLIESVLSEGKGKLLVWNDKKDRVACLKYGKFVFCESERISELMVDVIHALESRHMIISSHEVELANLLAGFEVFRRVAFSSNSLERTRLSALISQINSEYRIARVTAMNIERVASIDRNLTDSFDSLDTFLADGIGFCAIHKESGSIACSASSYAKARDSIEVQVSTANSHRRQGLATSVSAKLLHYCLESGLTPYWSAANETSERLAHRLGFQEERVFKVFWKE